CKPALGADWRKNEPAGALEAPAGRGFPGSKANADHFLILTLNPASLRAFTRAAASKSPVTSKVSPFGFPASPFTTSTFFPVSLIARQHAPQQVWTRVRVKLLTFPEGTSLASFMASFLSAVLP